MHQRLYFRRFFAVLTHQTVLTVVQIRYVDPIKLGGHSRHSFPTIDRLSVKTIENRIYIRGEFTRTKGKMAILVNCFHTAGVLHLFMLYNLLGPGISFYRKSKIIVKGNPNYEIGWFHN